MQDDFIVVGAGVIGLSVARRLSTMGSVTVLDRSRAGSESSWAAAGMLSPRSEVVGDDVLLRFGLSSLAAYPAFAGELQEETGVDPEYRTDGVLVLSRTEEEWEALEERALWQRSAGLDVEMLGPDEVVRLEPSIGPGVTGALFYADDHQVRPRRLLRALIRSCQLRGVRLVEGAPVERIPIESGRARGVQVGSGTAGAGAVIVTAGAWSSAIGPREAGFETRPRKGQILALGMPGPVIRHVVRWRNFYLVPRNDHELVVGATDEDAGFDRSVTVSGLGGLLAGAQAMAPCVSAFPVRETWTGFRPWIPDGLPRIGPSGVDGLYYATGHYRNGILLAPTTVGILEAHLTGTPLPAHAEEFPPKRSVAGSPASPAPVPDS
jgi:glycine oxidase